MDFSEEGCVGGVWDSCGLIGDGGLFGNFGGVKI